MRRIINISLPEKLGREVDKAVTSGHYASKSEFFRHLMRLWEEEKLLQSLRQSQKDIAQGKGKILKSFKDIR